MSLKIQKKVPGQTMQVRIIAGMCRSSTVLIMAEQRHVTVTPMTNILTNRTIVSIMGPGARNATMNAAKEQEIVIVNRMI